MLNIAYTNKIFVEVSLAIILIYYVNNLLYVKSQLFESVICAHVCGPTCVWSHRLWPVSN